MIINLHRNNLTSIFTFPPPSLLADCPTRWSLWYWYLDFYVDHLHISTTQLASCPPCQPCPQLPGALSSSFSCFSLFLLFLCSFLPHFLLLVLFCPLFFFLFFFALSTSLDLSDFQFGVVSSDWSYFQCSNVLTMFQSQCSNVLTGNAMWLSASCCLTRSCLCGGESLEF